MRSVAFGTISAVLVSVMWGFSFVAAQVALSVLSPVILATVRFGIASLIFAPVIAVEFYRGNHPDRRQLMELAFLGFISISIYFVLQYTGVDYAGAGISALLAVGLVPIMTGMTSAFFLHESYGIRRVRNPAGFRWCRIGHSARTLCEGD